MPAMRRAALVFVLLIAAAIAFEPLIHTHPLTQTSAVPCAVCVGSVGQVARLSVAENCPLVIVSYVMPAVAIAFQAPVSTSLASRAPPAA